jgi:hypothetical protein
MTAIDDPGAPALELCSVCEQDGFLFLRYPAQGGTRVRLDPTTPRERVHGEGP